MSKEFFKKTKSHGNKNTPASGAGMDEIKVKIPSGEKFTHYTILPSSGHFGAATFNVVDAPNKGGTGNQEIKVLWTNGPFSRCSYILKAYSRKVAAPNTPSVKPTIIVGSANWYNKAMNNLRQKIPFILRVQGVDAIKIFNALNPINNNLIRRSIVVNEAVSVTITATICVTIIALGGLAVLGSVLLYAIHQGCTTKAKYDTKASLPTATVGQIMDFEFMNCG